MSTIFRLLNRAMDDLSFVIPSIYGTKTILYAYLDSVWLLIMFFLYCFFSHEGGRTMNKKGLFINDNFYHGNSLIGIIRSSDRLTCA